METKKVFFSVSSDWCFLAILGNLFVFCCLAVPQSQAVVTVDAATELPWTATGSGTSDNVITIINTTPSTSSSNRLLFDGPQRAWVITNNGEIYHTTSTAIFYSAITGNTYDITNNGKLISEDPAGHGILFFNAGDTNITNHGTIQTFGSTNNVDTIHIETTGSRVANVNIVNDGIIHVSFSNAIEVYNTNNFTIRNEGSGQIIADGLRLALYAPGFITFSVFNGPNASIVSPNNFAISPGFTNGSTEGSQQVLIENQGIINAFGLYVAQTYYNIYTVENYTSIINSASGVINTTTAGASIRSVAYGAINDFLFVNDGHFSTQGTGISFVDFPTTPTIKEGIIGDFIFRNSGDFLAGLNGTGSAIVLDTHGADASVTVENSGTLQGANAALSVNNADASTPVTVTNAVGGSIVGTDTTITSHAISIVNGDIDINNMGTIAAAGGSGINISGTVNTVIDNSGAISGADSGIHITNTGTSPTVINSSGPITGGSGSGIYTESLPGQQVTINLNNGSNVSASSGMAITDTAGDATVNINSGSTLSGETHLGNGSDTLNINGGANISAATILDGGDDRTTGDGYVDVINFNGVNQSLQGSRIVNWELMNLNSSLLTITDGTLAVGDGTTGTGVFLNNGSTLDGSNSLALDANLGIDRSSTFELTGNGSGDYSVSYNLTNAGTLNMADGVVGDHLSVGGDYVSDGSVMLVDVDFNPLTADYMTVDGKVSGNGTIAIHDITTGYSYSKGEILLIEETTDSNKADESFVLAPANRYNGASDLGRFTSTPFIWRLKTTGNDWVLGYAFDAPQEKTPTKTKNSTGGTATATTSTGKHAVVSEIPAYISLPSFSYEMVNNELDTLHMRLGELRHFRPTVGSPDLLGLRQYDPSIEFDESKINGWARVTYANFKFEPEKNFEMNGEYGATNLGFDKKIKLQDSALFTGIFGGISRGRFSNDGRGSEFGSLYEADTDIDAWSLGLYATWFGSQGYYLDLVGEYMGMDADIEAVDHYQTDGHMLGFSAELGKSYEVRENLVLEPQAQLKVADVAWDGFNDGWNDVSFADHTYLTGRLGLRGEYTTHAGKDGQAEIKPWLYAGIQHEFTDAPDVTYVIDFESHQYDTTANIQAGITAHLAKWMQLYVDAGLTSNFDDYYSMRLDCGLRLKW